MSDKKSAILILFSHFVNLTYTPKNMRQLHRLTILSSISILSLAIVHPPALARDVDWEYQGIASTGEHVNLDLNSIAVVSLSARSSRPPSYFFNYKIGNDRVTAITGCTGTFAPFKNADETDSFRKPQSKAMQRTLDRVCSYTVKRVRVFAPPSNIRAEPNGRIICTIQNTKTITTYGIYNYGQNVNWQYTDACGKLGVIDSSKFR